MSGLFDRGPREQGAAEARGLVRRVAVQAFGAVAVPEPIEEFSTTRPGLDDPLAGVRAAGLVWDVAAGQLREWALRARGAGSGWEDVADALGLSDVEDALEGRTTSEAAWEWLVEHRPPAPGRSLVDRPASAVWTCTTCRGRVRDIGPYEPHPDDRETGHASGCARHIAALAAWRRDLDSEEEDW